jgi:predicted acetyltransferase
MPHDHKSLPIDPASAAALAEGNLRMELLDTSDVAHYEQWVQASNRGFHGALLTEEQSTGFMAGMVDRRSTGIWDGDEPVGTVNSFPSPLTVPGGSDIPAWAISMVTVAPTHRRRGIARELLQSELRTATQLGIPMAMLTVSESTIYSRFGFAPAVMAANITIDTRRARWAGPIAGGRVRFVPLDELRPVVDALYATARLASPGEIEVWPRRWDQILGIPEEEKDITKRPRAVRYDDASGTPQGFAVYRVKEDEHDFSAHTAQVEYLMANTADAYAALWRFLLELDLTSTVCAQLRSVDEPVRWLVNDFRAVKVETSDHLWLRILDVPAALQARAYFASANLVLEVTDALGHAAGTYSFAVDGGVALVAPVDSTGPASTEPTLTEPASTGPALTLSINELSALYLGGVSAVTLQRAGRIVEHLPGSVAMLDSAFRSPLTPWLSVWF